MNDMRSFRLLVGLLAAAWIVVGVAIGFGLVQAHALGEPMGVTTLAGIVVGAVGLIGTWLLRKWGPLAYVTANIVLAIKPWLFGVPASAGGLGWGYWLLLALFVGVVAVNWNRFSK